MVDPEKLEAILSRYEGDPADLIQVLEEVQDEYGYLPQEALKTVASRLEVPLTRVFSVATFYRMFTLTPKGRHRVRVCQGTPCHLKGSGRLNESLGHRLGVSSGRSTPDAQFHLEDAQCLGACVHAPVIMVDDKYFGRMAVERVGKTLKPYRKPKQSKSHGQD
jgi:NADH-quinone oxidoreductase E subunit